MGLAVQRRCKCIVILTSPFAAPRPSTRRQKLTSDRARQGANLCLACRIPPPTEPHPADVVEECKANAKAAGQVASEIEWWELDMSSLASVEAFAQSWLDTGRRLVRRYHQYRHMVNFPLIRIRVQDVLCNNAGIGSSPGGDDVFKTKDGFEIIHQARNGNPGHAPGS